MAVLGFNSPKVHFSLLSKEKTKKKKRKARWRWCGNVVTVGLWPPVEPVCGTSLGEVQAILDVGLGDGTFEAMKKYLVIANVIVVSLLTSLQLNAQKGFSVLPNLSIGEVGMTNDNLYEHGLNHYFERYQGGGVEAGYMFNNYVGLFAGVNYSEFNYEVQNRPNYTPMLQDYVKQSYIQIPLYFRLHTGKRQHLGFFLHAGFRIESLMAIDESLTIDYQYKHSTSKKGYTSWQVSPMLNFGFHIPCGRRVFLNIGPDTHFHVDDDFDGVYSGALLQLGGKLSVGINFAHLDPKKKN